MRYGLRIFFGVLCLSLMVMSETKAEAVVSDKDKFSEIQNAYLKCSLIEAELETVKNVRISYQAQYECYKKVVFQLIDAFQPKVADEVKMSFLQYLEAYDKMIDNQYLSLEPCGGSCGTMVEDYIAIDRANMMGTVARGYILAVKGYI